MPMEVVPDAAHQVQANYGTENRAETIIASDVIESMDDEIQSSTPNDLPTLDLFL